MGAVKSEEFVLPDPANDPESILASVKSRGLAVDIFTFMQRPPDVTPRFPYRMRWDNVAALPLLGYEEWWEKRLNQDTRRCVRVAAKRGLTVQLVPFDDALCEGIRGIYNETPIRQGRKFWHYGKAFDAVKSENSTYLDRCDFIGAYFGPELVGFLKLVYTGQTAGIMQILSKTSHYDRRPMNALMAKAVEICNQKKLQFLQYRKYNYNKGLPDSMAEFKRRNGFEQINVPRYYVPLSMKGRLALSLNLHLDAAEILPPKLVTAAKSVRSKYYQARMVLRKTPASDA